MYADKKVIDLINESEKEVREQFDKVEKICEKNSLKVLTAFQKNGIGRSSF